MRSNFLVLFLVGLAVAACNNPGKGQLSTGTSTGTDSSNNAAEKPPKQTLPTPDFLIVAGEQVGHVHIMDSAAKTLRLLGRPDGGDAAMGSATLTWMGKGAPPTQLDVYTHYRDSTMLDKAVKQIRTTSPDFSTANGLQVGLLLTEAMQLQPGLKALPADGGNRKGTRLYDDAGNGLAVEADSATTNAQILSIIIHEKGRSVRPLYR